MEELAARVDELFLGDAGRGHALETEMQTLVTQVREARREHDVQLALPGVERLERIATNLADSKGYEALAAVYWRTLLERYGQLEEEAPDIARRLETAAKALETLKADENVQGALPPVPKAR
jgi:hypothetical protein